MKKVVCHGNIVTKRIGSAEYEILKHLKNTDIIPHIIELKPQQVTMSKYPITLNQYVEEHNIRDIAGLGDLFDKIIKKIGALHDLNIFHGDLHTSNIVIDPIQRDVRIIDFGESKLISKINEDDISYYNEFLGVDPSLVDLINYELDNWVYDFKTNDKI